MKPLTICLCLIMSASALANLKPAALKCEYLVNPIGIDTLKPRLSWIVESNQRGQKQTAYQIIVSGEEKTLSASKGDVWDSGKVASDETLHIEFGGPPLRTAQRCYWKVRVWDKDGSPSAYCKPSFWEMGVLRASEWQSKWIARTEETAYQPAPLFRKVFEVNPKVKRARAYICGLGYYELRLNGKKVGDHELDPGYTRYDRRHLYVTYDVTKQLKSGPNAAGIMLGTGWFNEHTKAVWYFDRAPWRQSPRVLMEIRIEYEDGKAEIITTDDSWKTSTGPVIFDSIYGGETYDARLEKPGWDKAGYDDSAWQSARVVDSPKGLLAAQQHVPIRITQAVKPARLTQPKPGVFVFDIGQNLTGWSELRVNGPAGTNIRLKYGEKLNKDGTVDQANINEHQLKTNPPQPFQTDNYILKGKGIETWHARFCYHGFQYVEVTGSPGTPTLDSLRALFVHSDVPPAGEFACSNELLNKIQTCTHWSYLSNLEGIPTDCPHREKNGWTGDAHLAAEQALFNFQPQSVYTKWIQDLDDEMRDSGELPGIVPTSGWGYEWGNGPAWDSAFLLIPWYMYVYSGDTRILTSHYEKMKRYVDYLTTRSKDGIVSIGLGDWVPYKTETPVEVTSTGYYYRDALIVAKAAELAGNQDDARTYTQLAESIRSAFNKKFFDPKNGLYANGSQTALSCALYQGLIEPVNKEAVLQNLADNLAKTGGHIDTGILGAKYLPNCLTDNGRADLAYQIASQKDNPGWGDWLEHGATTLWEAWDGGGSRNHIMFGDISSWMYKTLAGINPDPSSPGFKHFIIKPNIVGDLTWARASYNSAHGLIESDWKVEAGLLTLRIRVPANTTAMVSIPARSAASVTESKKPLQRAPGVQIKGEGPGFVEVGVESGTYIFTAPRN